MELTMSMFATQADYWKARAEIAERALSDIGVTPAEARAGVERSKANQKDAERYRWLRDVAEPANWEMFGYQYRLHLDATLDAAMAREADPGFGDGVLPTSIVGEEAIERFFRLAQAAAYERAAKVCDEGGAWRTPGHCAKLIRALK